MITRTRASSGRAPSRSARCSVERPVLGDALAGDPCPQRRRVLQDATELQDTLALGRLDVRGLDVGLAQRLDRALVWRPGPKCHQQPLLQSTFVVEDDLVLGCEVAKERPWR